MKRLKLNIGDVFTIPLENGEFSFGQILKFSVSKSVFIMCTFKIKDSEINVNKLVQICNSEILLLGYSNDAKLYHKDWLIIGNYVHNLEFIKLPYYRLGLPPDSYLVNFRGELIKKIVKDIFDKLTYETEFSPQIFENAMKAYFGLREWIDEDYNRMLYEYTLKSNEIAEKVISCN